MSHSEQSAEHSIIELAMARASRGKAPADLPSPEADRVERSPGRRIYDAALSRRVNPAHSAPAEAKHSFPAASLNAEAGQASAARAWPRYLLPIASHVISATAGAVVMWYAMSGPVQPRPVQSKPVLPATAAVAAIPVPAAANLPVAPPAAMSVDAQVRAMLENWRQSWSSRAVDSYLGFYSTHFVPADGTTRSVWAESRRKNFLGKSSISVGIHDVTVVPIDSQHVKVSLLQDYASGSYKETRQPKTFLLAQDGGEWRITGEWQGDPAPGAAIRK